MRFRFDQAEEDDVHRWMVSYADLLTLLFAFFVVMYAISTVNMYKYKRLTGSIQNAFGSRSGEGQGSKEYLGANPLEGLEKGIAQGESDEPGLDIINLDSILDSKMMKIRNFNKDWIEIEMRSNMVFKSGDADPKVKAIEELKKVAKELKKLPYRVIVEGYTDNVPISTVLYPSNWELSAARAAAVVRVLTSFGVKEQNISAVGFGEQFPIDSNKSAQGRENNRRVVIVVARDQHVARILNPWADAPPEAPKKITSSPDHQKLREKRAKEAQEAKRELKELISQTRQKELELEREKARENKALEQEKLRKNKRQLKDNVKQPEPKR